jgi:hypothetical protein
MRLDWAPCADISETEKEYARRRIPQIEIRRHQFGLNLGPNQRDRHPAMQCETIRPQLPQEGAYANAGMPETRDQQILDSNL